MKTKPYKINKLLNVWSLILTIFLSIILVAIIVGRMINWDVCPDIYKHLVYNLYKYIIFFVLFLSIPIPVLLFLIFLKHDKRNVFKFYCILKSCLMSVIIIFLIVLLFVFTKRYVIKIEIWYGYISFYASLIAILGCLFFSCCKLNYVEISSTYILTKKTINRIGFKYELFWIILCSFVGLTLMFRIRLVHQTITLIILMLLIESFFKMTIIYYLKKRNVIETNFHFLYLILAILLICYVGVSYFIMYPTKIIGIIRINYYVAFSNYLLCLIMANPIFIISGAIH